MPIPDKPYTRREAYLNAAATGDSSGIPETPYTREEMYLDAIAKNGGGGGGGGGSSTLSGLTDVDISNPTDGQALVYNATSGKWENGSAGGGGVLVVTLDVNNGYQADHTSADIFDAITNASVLFREEITSGFYKVYPILWYGSQTVGADMYYSFILGQYDEPTMSYKTLELMGVGADSYPKVQEE